MPAELHHEWGSSQLTKRMRCLGSQNAERGRPDEPSEYADEGSVAHALAETCHFTGEDPEKYLGVALLKDKGIDIEVDEDMVFYVREYLKQIKRIAKTADDEFIERTVRYEAWVPGAFATLDHGTVHREAKAIQIGDLKYGRGVEVDPEESEQLRGLALGLYDEIKHQMQIEKIWLNVHQVRRDMKPKTHVMDIGELLVFGQKLRDAYAAAQAEDAPRTPGEKQCQFCKARHDCRERIEWQLAGAEVEFDFDNPDAKLELPNADTIPLEKLARIFPYLSGLAKWATGLEAHIHDQHVSGNKLPGHKLVEGGRSLRYWLDKDAVEAEVKRMRAPPDLAYKKSLQTPAQMEKAVGPRQWKMLQKFIGWTRKKLILVPMDDPRPAAGPDTDPTADFDFEEPQQETTTATKTNDIDFI